MQRTPYYRNSLIAKQLQIARQLLQIGLDDFVFPSALLCSVSSTENSRRPFSRTRIYRTVPRSIVPFGTSLDTWHSPMPARTHKPVLVPPVFHYFRFRIINPRTRGILQREIVKKSNSRILACMLIYPFRLIDIPTRACHCSGQCFLIPVLP